MGSLNHWEVASLEVSPSWPFRGVLTPPQEDLTEALWIGGWRPGVPALPWV